MLEKTIIIYELISNKGFGSFLMEIKNLVKIHSLNVIMLCVKIGKYLNSEEYKQ